MSEAPPDGDSAAIDLDALVPEVYDALRRIARRHLRQHAPGVTLGTTAVVHETYLKLAQGRGRWSERAHFFALASTAMRQLLVDHARRRNAEKRGAGAVHVTLIDGAMMAPDSAGLDVLELDSALGALAAIDPHLVRVVECRFFAGLGVEDTAEALGRSTRSVERDWARARAYLYDALTPP
jgi:RNA polymerase sigma factor (TIGR02999 family)